MIAIRIADVRSRSLNISLALTRKSWHSDAVALKGLQSVAQYRRQQCQLRPQTYYSLTFKPPNRRCREVKSRIAPRKSC